MTEPTPTTETASGVDTATQEDALHRALDAERVVERYLLDRLDDEQARRFERHYLDCPICLERLELSEGLIEGIRHAATEDGLRLVAGRSLVAWLARLGPWRRAVFAAAALLVLVPALWLGWRAVELDGQVAELRRQIASLEAPRSDPWMLSLAPERGASGEDPLPRELHLPAEERSIVLALELGLEPGSEQRLTLEDDQGAMLWSQRVRADLTGRLVVTFSSQFLPEGEIALVVHDAGGAENARLPVRVVASTSP